MVLTMKRNIPALKDEITHAKEGVLNGMKLAEREATLKVSENKFEEFKDTAEAVIASLKAKCLSSMRNCWILHRLPRWRVGPG